MNAPNAFCDICKQPFLKKKRNQRYCTRECYEQAWRTNNREAWNARSRRHREENPTWHKLREPQYYKTYRSKLESSRPWTYLLRSRKNEAKIKNIPFDLTNEWAAARWTGHCELTGLKFLATGKPGPHPFSPSIDKIAAQKRYTQTNSRFILLGCNALKGSGTDTDMHKIAEALMRSNFQDAATMLSLPG
jgi:hypothetical protein